MIVFYIRPFNVFFMICSLNHSSMNAVILTSIPIISCRKIAWALMFTILLKWTINKSLFIFLLCHFSTYWVHIYCIDWLHINCIYCIDRLHIYILLLPLLLWVCSNKSIPLATMAKDPEILLATNNFL